MRIEDAVGARIRTFRQARGLTQAQLGQLVPPAWPRQVVSAMEKGDRAFAVAELAAVAEALGVSISDLVGEPSATTASGFLGGPRLRVQAIEEQLKELAAELEALAGGGL